MSVQTQTLAEIRDLLDQMREMIEALRHDDRAHRLAMNSVFALEDFLFAMERDGIPSRKSSGIKLDRPAAE